MKRNRGLPKWVVALLTLVAIVVFGPPVLRLLFGVLGVGVWLAAALLKLGVVALVLFAVVAVVRAVFKPSTPRAERLRDVDATATHEVDESRRALDAELERAIAASEK